MKNFILPLSLLGLTRSVLANNKLPDIHSNPLLVTANFDDPGLELDGINDFLPDVENVMEYDDTIDPLGMHVINPDFDTEISLSRIYFPNEENSMDQADGDVQWSSSDSPVRSVASAKIGTFQPLDCNSNPWSNCGSNLVSSIIASGTATLTIPCGQCYTFDVEGNVTLGGLDIQGKLLFPLNHKVNIYTPYVVVQGELEINVNHATISPDHVSTNFILTGTQDVLFTPTESPNQNACSGATLGKCNLGKKAFVIAGGKLNIRGMPDDDTSPSPCATYTPVLKKIHKDPVVDPKNFAKFTLLPDTCPSSGRSFVKYDFETSYGNWTGRDGSFVNLGNGSVRMSRRLLSDRGPYLDLTAMSPPYCLVPGQVYLLSAR